MAKYWFARQRLDRPFNRRMTPISREGWLVVAGFGACMVIGGAAMAAFMATSMPLIGIAIFAALAITGGATFITLAYKRGDDQHSAEDYRLGRVSNEEGPIT